MSSFGQTDLSREIESAQSMYEQAITAKDYKLSRDLLTTIAALKKSQRIYLEKSGLMMEKAAVLRVASVLSAIVEDTFRPGFAGTDEEFGQRMDTLCARMRTEITGTTLGIE